MDKSIQKTTLYRYFDSEGRLLYVGITKNQFDRLDAHAKTQSWWHEVAHGTFTHLDSREEALTAETHAIGTEFPKYNKAGPVLELPGQEHLVDLIANNYLDEFHQRMSASMSARMIEINQFSNQPEAYKLLFSFVDSIPWDADGNEMLIDCLKCQDIVDSKWFRQQYESVHSTICEEFVP